MSLNEKNLIVEDATKRFQQIMEYVVNQGAKQVLEADDEPNQEENPNEQPIDGVDQNMDMGGMDQSMGGDAAPDMDMPDQNMDMNADPNMGGDQNMGGGPQGFNPEEGEGIEGEMGMDDGFDQMQPDDEVIDVDDLTNAQEETEKEVSKINSKFDKVLKAIGAFEELLQSNDAKIEALKSEFEKRNPTQVEKLSMQTARSYPFNVTPEEYWEEKEATSNYSTEDDKNGKEQGQYVITQKDIDGETNWSDIAKSLNGDDFMYNQTLKGVLGI